MKEFAESMNEILIIVYRNIIKNEEVYLKKLSNSNLSMNEIHIIDYIGSCQSGDKKVSISDIATELSITRPSATMAISKLERKGFVEKISSYDDKRVVYVSLTEEGRKIMTLHDNYHKKMVNDIVDNFDSKEKTCLLEVMYKLNDFFINYNGERKNEF